MQALTHGSPHHQKSHAWAKSDSVTRKRGPNLISLSTQLATVQISCPKDEVKKKKPPEIIKGPKEGGKSDVFYDDTMVSKQAVHSLGLTKRFSSARGALSHFDWGTHGAVVVPDCQDGCRER